MVQPKVHHVHHYEESDDNFKVVIRYKFLPMGSHFRPVRGIRYAKNSVEGIVGSTINFFSLAQTRHNFSVSLLKFISHHGIGEYPDGKSSKEKGKDKVDDVPRPMNCPYLK